MVLGIRRKDEWKVIDAARRGDAGQVLTVISGRPELLNQGVPLAIFQKYPDLVPGETPLHAAAQFGQIDVVKMLLNSRADPNIARVDGQSPLHLAAKANHASVADLLLDHGARANATDEKDQTPLHFAAAHDALTAAEVLLQRGGRAVARDRGRNSPVHAAALRCNPDMLRLLLDADGQVLKLNSEGRSPLHMAMVGAGGSVEDLSPPVEQVLATIDLLASRQADPNEKDGAGETALDLLLSHAVADGLDPIIAHLKSIGGTFAHFEDLDDRDYDLLNESMHEGDAIAGLRVAIDLPLDTSITVGRSSGCTVHLDHVELSRRHAKIRRSADRIAVVDLDSRNGTFVNGKRLEKPRKLVEGDIVAFGPFEYVVEAERLAPSMRRDGKGSIDLSSLFDAG